jgi:hypothetical protein
MSELKLRPPKEKNKKSARLPAGLDRQKVAATRTKIISLTRKRRGIRDDTHFQFSQRF